MGIYINPLNGRKINAWSFHYTPLRLDWKPPYFIYFSYGKDSSPLKFTLEFEVSVYRGECITYILFILQVIRSQKGKIRVLTDYFIAYAIYKSYNPPKKKFEITSPNHTIQPKIKSYDETSHQVINII